MQFKFSSKATMIIDDKPYEFSRVSKDVARKYQDKMKDAEENERLDVFYALLKDLGLPDEALAKIPVDALPELIEGLLGAPKNSPRPS